MAVLLVVATIVGCGEKSDPTETASPSAGKEKFTPANSKSNPVANYHTAPAGQGDALK